MVGRAVVAEYQKSFPAAQGASRLSLPDAYDPVRPRHFKVESICLAKGSLTSPERRRFVERICAVCPDAKRLHVPDVAHNRIKLDCPDALDLHRTGKRTLVFGELGTPVRFSEEEGNACPNYWHFSPYGFCPYGCKYCYLAGTAGVWHSPTVKVYVNLDEIVDAIDRTANRLTQPTAFYLGKLQDGLALDPLTAYSTVLIPFFAQHRFARQVILTKSSCVDRLLDLDHRGRTVLSWSLLPPQVSRRFEENVPSVGRRLDAMRRCAASGYPIRAVIMPIILVPGWQELYSGFLRRLVVDLPIHRLTLGGICIYRRARSLMERKLGWSNVISQNIDEEALVGDGRARYSRATRKRVYRALIRAVRDARSDLDIALCLEEREVWDDLDLTDQLGRCNCVL